MPPKSRLLSRPENVQLYKTLPLRPLPPPLLTFLELENAKLKEEKKRLEAVVEILYKQNLQYSEAFNRHEVFDREVRKEMDRTLHVMTGIAKMQFQNYFKMQTIKEQTVTDWEEFCSEIKIEEANSVENVLEDIKERMIEKNLRETEEVIIGMEFMI
ncbi:hypothetical protein FGG08_000642 [Glutinoglossum americanum]|uniref:Uncharacterized protein n=1 Tax=Glutinoglossum americanum TaxID=1670608 RepID=A0A9P8ID49_9PEZI|nr:hypothetical protein FGG08_000642 [Glutinoglossum americanum]